jgi:glycosyltransferase involved in cell wall biosynthesis
MSTGRPLRVCLIASSRFPIREPFAGGLEAHTHALAGELIRRGHHVSLFAAPGSDPTLGAHELDVDTFTSSGAARADVASPPERWIREHHAYLRLMLDLVRDGARRFDVVHNNSLHHLPVAMAEALPIPLVTTLHTPPVAWLESAARWAPPSSRFAAVSHEMGRSWRHVLRATTVHNGVDTDRWAVGPGGEGAIWTGRIVPEKAPHAAIDAARTAGVPLRLAGPVHDDAYFRREVSPRLGDDVQFLGHLSQADLCEFVGRAGVALVTPAWEEPYGLVVAEAMACGTPVAAFARGAMRELVDADTGRLARPADTVGLASAIREAADLSRTRVRAVAVEKWGLARMVDEYEALYRSLARRGVAA